METQKDHIRTLISCRPCQSLVDYANTEKRKRKEQHALSDGWHDFAAAGFRRGKRPASPVKEIPMEHFFFHVEEEILHIQNCSSMFPRDHSTPSACTQTGKIIILIFPVNHAAIRRRGGMTLGPHRPQTISHRVLRRKRSAGLVMVL